MPHSILRGRQSDYTYGLTLWLQLTRNSLAGPEDLVNNPNDSLCSSSGSVARNGLLVDESGAPTWPHSCSVGCCCYCLKRPSLIV